jgi:hypothetical protein
LSSAPAAFTQIYSPLAAYKSRTRISAAEELESPNPVSTLATNKAAKPWDFLTVGTPCVRLRQRMVDEDRRRQIGGDPHLSRRSPY